MRRIVSVCTVVLLSFLYSGVADAKVYKSVQSALRQIFSKGETVTKRTLWLSHDARKAIEKRTGSRISSRRVVFHAGVLDGKLSGIAVIDNVIGKKEFITYMVVLESDGSVRLVDILEYRESQGWEITDQKWLVQFHGKGTGDPLQLNRDIVRISGATLSSRAIASGVKKIIYLFQYALKKQIFENT